MRNFILIFTAIFANVLLSAEVICPDKADVWLSGSGSERDTNNGKTPKIKLKSWQEFGILDFDVSALKGKKIEKAVLHIAPADGIRFGKDRGTDLRWFSLSSVSSAWVEGEGTSYAKDDKGHGATFNEASYKTRPWAFPGSKLWDVILGNGKSLRCDVDGGDPKNGWFEIPIDKKLVEAMVADASHGIFIMDGSVGISTNAYINSRESKKAPFLTVTVSGDDKTAPVAPTNLKVAAAPNDATLKEGAIEVSFTVPEKAFAYQIKLNDKPVERWQIPFATKPGSTQSFPITFLQPDTDLKVEVAAVDTAGNVSPFATANVKSSPKVTVPRLPAYDNNWQQAGSGAKTSNDKLKVWAFPEISKLDPLSGQIILEKGTEKAAESNTVWNAAGGLIHISAARGEIAAFQLALEALQGNADNLKVNVSGLEGVQVKLWRTWFVKIKDKWQAEYALPIKADEALTIPAADNKIKDQKATVVAVDLIVSEKAKASEQSGTITISGAGDEIKLKLSLKIYDAVIPSELNFFGELNAYGGPGQAGSEQFFDSFRLAHYHRCSINRVPHSHHGQTHDDWKPDVGPDGHVTNWERFDKNLGPLLDGTAFKDMPRAGVPVPFLYLPINENFPLMMKPNYNPGCPTEGADWSIIHAMRAKPPEEAFSQKYQQAYVNATRDFVKHAEEKGWNKTLLEGFHNNKVQYNKDKLQGTAWTLDEPTLYTDWHALKFFSKLFHQGLDGVKTTKFVFRADISRMTWQGSMFDGLMEVLVSAGEIFEAPMCAKDNKRRMPSKLVVYGGANDQSRANHESTAWCLKAHVYECDGVLPWQTLGGDEAFDKGDNLDNGNALIVDGRKRFGLNAVASFRIHAFRSGAQIVELLHLLEKKNSWSRTHSGALVAQLIPLSSEFKQSFVDDAAAYTFNDLSGDNFVRLKEGLLKLLEK